MTFSVLFVCATIALLPKVDSLWCYQCVSTQPGCGTPFDWRWYTPTTCEKCVKIIERKGSEEVITRNCLSLIEYSRHDIPADKYEGCRPAAKDVRLAHYVTSSIKELDVKRDYYDNVTFCFCEFDNWCNSSYTNVASPLLIGLLLLGFLFRN